MVFMKAGKLLAMVGKNNADATSEVLRSTEYGCNYPSTRYEFAEFWDNIGEVSVETVHPPTRVNVSLGYARLSAWPRTLLFLFFIFISARANG
jgi:hypothetical protein